MIKNTKLMQNKIFTFTKKMKKKQKDKSNRYLLINNAIHAVKRFHLDEPAKYMEFQKLRYIIN